MKVYFAIFHTIVNHFVTLLIFPDFFLYFCTVFKTKKHTTMKIKLTTEQIQKIDTDTATASCAAASVTVIQPYTYVNDC